MNHALLPSVANASLPQKYTAAKLALADCDRIDECKDWSDKSAALASYAKQSGDKTLENTAMKIRARAVRRCGELLQEIERANGANQNIRGGESPKVFTRRDAAADAGMSVDQAKDAIRIANIPAESFEAQIESENPPTITALAEQGKQTAKTVPLYEKLGMTREQFQAGMYFCGDVARFLKATQTYSFEDVAAGTEPKDRRKLRNDLGEIEQYITKLKAKL